MERRLKVCLDLLIEDSAIVCRDDPTQREIVLSAGGGDMYVSKYVRSNFLKAFGPDRDQGAWENICAFTDPNTLVVEVFPNLEPGEEEALTTALQILRSTSTDAVNEREGIEGLEGERPALEMYKRYLVNIEGIAAKLGLKL